MSISLSQSESSIRSYSAHVDDKKKQDMAMSISKSIFGDYILGMKFNTCIECIF